MSENVGGFGGRCARKKHRRRLVQRALRECWTIPPELRACLIERLGNIVQDSTARPRDVTAAGRAILAASKINLDHISVTIKAHMHADIERRLDVVERRVNEREGG